MVRTGLIRTALILSVIWRISGQRLCPRLQRPWNGQFVGNCNRNVGAQCTFRCREPYILVGSRVRVCKSDRTWSGTSTACELDGCANCYGGNSNCPSIYNPDNGYTEGQCTPGIIGQTCQFRCNSGYTLEGNFQISCSNGGQWNGQAPVCRMTSAAICDEIVIPNGYTNCYQQGGLTVCNVVCEEGYMIVGSSVITCSSSGDWNDIVPSCRRIGIEVANVCPTLNPPDGGRLVGSCTSANTGDTCQLVCLSGYRPTDTRVLVCQSNGLWSDSLPRCVGDAMSCPVISVSGGSTSGSCGPAQVGQVCTVTCNSGYNLSGGSGTLVCQSNGQWSSTIPRCNMATTCPALPAPASGGVSGTCSPGQVGQTCNFYCNSGYQLVGQNSLVCGSDGRWSGNSPYCTGATCPNLNTPANGATSGTCTQATSGQSCYFSCQAGYTLTGQSSLVCQSGGTWSSNSPTCTRATCPNLNTPANALTFGTCSQASVGQSCTFACQSGYTLSGQATLYCQNGGTWSGSPPQCIPSAVTSCSSLGAPGNGFMNGACAPGRVGETCTFACNSGFTLVGQSTLTCQANGQWSSDAPRCDSTDTGDNGNGGNCPVLTPPPNGQFVECDNNPGGQCIVACESGYVRSGSRVRTCLGQGTWSGYAPTCTRTVGYQTTYRYKVVPLWQLVFG